MNTFHSNIISIYGQRGKAWLDEVPELVVAISSRLELRDLKEVTNLTYNYVLSGFQGDNPIILKLGLDHESLTREAFALKCFAGCGAVKVLAEDKGMLLLERAMPGISLKSYFLLLELILFSAPAVGISANTKHLKPCAEIV
jgi:streptomycin 6-kinase